MSHLSKIFEETPIKVQNRNGFDLSHVHSGTSKCGQLVPVLTKLLAPNSTISLGVNAEVSLPPLVAPFYGKIDFAIEGFIVPCSILYGGWKQFISNQEATQFPASQVDLSPGLSLSDGLNRQYVEGSSSQLGYIKPVLHNADTLGYALPWFDFISASRSDLASYKTLSSTNDNIYDYMGLNSDASTTTSAVVRTLPINLLPALAYHKICDVFYRNTKLTRTWFAVNPNGDISGVAPSTGDLVNAKNVSLIWHSFYTNNALFNDDNSEFTSGARFTTLGELTFPDDVSVFSTRQRTYMRDYFTSAVYNPQQGGASTLRFSVDIDTGEGEFTINSLRMANSLQKFLETNNLSGDYADMVRNRWGVRPIDADFEEPHYLGRVVIPVYQHTLYQNNQVAEDVSTTNNPYVNRGLLGASGGAAKASGEGSICDNFNVSCWSYLMCLASIYPHANYNYGINRELTMIRLGDFPAPELQSVGMEEISNYELSASVTNQTTTSFFDTFGYIPRYSRFKYVDDHSSGELRPGKTLQYFQLQRSFSGIPQLGTSFVTIAQNALDGVLSVNTSVMNLTCWWEIFFAFKVVMPLADYCIPTLGELADTHTIKTKTAGSRL